MPYDQCTSEPSAPPWRFGGLRRPGYTQIPDDYLDEVMAHVSPIEWKALCYIARRTFGFKKDSDAISLHQICRGITKRTGEPLDYGTGLSKSSATKALCGLIAKGIIRRTANDSDEHGHVASTYHVVFADDDEAQTLVHNAHKLVQGASPDRSPRGQALVHTVAPQQRRSQQTQHNRMRAPTAHHTLADYARSSYVCSGCGSNRCRPSCAAQECPDRRAQAE